MTRKIVDKNIAYTGRVFELQNLEIQLENNEIIKRDILKMGFSGAVAVLAVTKENKVILVKQYRAGADKYLIEVPAGLIDEGETPEEAAIRELEEEGGYKAKKLKKLTEFYTTPGFTNEIIYVFEAFDLEKTEQNLDHDEYIDVIEYPIEKVDELDLKDVKTLVTLNFLKNKLKK
ncbi:NUDIX hydrolase [Haliovirga abyssi]|uniref:ADP-ribose pyrophosphatase n=1 Tax=Haliovirga abyssi TaxID=2996794 RepID=A0AAU9DAV3_9FUSO|nr:NUDIX hydrolase [Haliovirga abyssi]BDU50440.1 ADP-ribose pyrophosphatase [Haliovirga abyssi]